MSARTLAEADKQRIVHECQVRPEWLDLKALQQYACVSERTFREWIHRPRNPLPAVRVGAKVLVRRSDLDRWLRSHRVKNADISRIVEQILMGMKAS